MAPTKSVPAALHSELSEYASLLRAIRTKSTLDIVPQLSRPATHLEDLDDGSDESEEAFQLSDNEILQGPTKHSEISVAATTLSKGKGKPKAPSKGVRKSKSTRKGDDTWTRWPLLQEHCPVPEWSFDEEVVAIAEPCLRLQSSSSPCGATSTTVVNQDALEDNIDEFTLSHAYLAGLTSETASKLSSILSLLAFHRPNAIFTKHGRVAPMSWEDVLEVVGVAGLFDQATVEDVKQRMEAVFGPSQSQVINRMQVLEASNHALEEAEASFLSDIAENMSPRPKRRRAKKHSSAIFGAEKFQNVKSTADTQPVDGSQASSSEEVQDVDMDIVVPN